MIHWRPAEPPLAQAVLRTEKEGLRKLVFICLGVLAVVTAVLVLLVWNYYMGMIHGAQRGIQMLWQEEYIYIRLNGEEYAAAIRGAGVRAGFYFGLPEAAILLATGVPLGREIAVYRRMKKSLFVCEASCAGRTYVRGWHYLSAVLPDGQVVEEVRVRRELYDAAMIGKPVLLVAMGASRPVRRIYPERVLHRVQQEAGMEMAGVDG